MYALWKNHYQMIVVLTDKLLKTGIIECSAIANWIFSKEMASEFTKYLILDGDVLRQLFLINSV